MITMRSFTDEHGIVGWIFDEKTHPLGNANPKNIKVATPVVKVDAPKVVVTAPKVKEKKK
jgi:hypothetical protein